MMRKNVKDSVCWLVIEKKIYKKCFKCGVKISNILYKHLCDNMEDFVGSFDI